MRKILFATLPGGHFWSYGPSWTNIDLTNVLGGLSDLGYLVSVVEITDLLNQSLESNDIVIYTSSDNPELRQYVKDVMYLVSRNCRIVPSYEGLLAHENKGFQQIYRAMHGFGDLEGAYGVGPELLEAPMPYVFKRISGAGSASVELVRNSNDKRRVVRKHFSRSARRLLIDTYRSFTLPREDFDRYKQRKAAFAASVRQEFVPGLECDYKVLVFGDRFFVLRRGVRKNDFRASGSGRFTFVAPPEEVLDFAFKVHECLDSPYSSLDIVVSNNGRPSLVEYQCVSFGPYTVVGSPGYYFKEGHGWVYREGRTTLEGAISHGIRHFIVHLNGTGA